MRAIAFALAFFAAGCDGSGSDDTNADSIPSNPVVADRTDSVPHAALGDSAQNDAVLLAPGIHIDSILPLDRFILLGLRRVGSSRAEMVKYLGPPDSVRSEGFQNRHDPSVTDSTHQLFYRDAEASFYRTQNGHEMLMDVTLVDNRLLLLPTIQIGMSWDSVVAKFGQPQPEGDIFRFTCSVCEVEHSVTLATRDNRVSRIGFSYYVD